ncbi:MAG TPA: energy-coupling factor transporter ATPase [Geobacterales bacterium]|nr:energy-coupling factor transporter ATPase [Geobacterales bacterium]
MNILEVKKFFFKYRNSKDWILKNIDLELERGKTLLILGPNGSGKSTLALSILGIAQKYPSEFRGEIFFKGKNILEYDRAELARYCSIVQQDPEAQIVTLFVEDEIAFGLENLLYKDIDERISKALSMTKLEHKRQEETSALSYGEKQKTMLASVLALDNELLILDEPTSNLDPIARKDFFNIIRELKQRGTSLVIIEHNIDEIFNIIDDVVVLNRNGEVVVKGKFPEVLYKLNPSILEDLGIWLPVSFEIEILRKIDTKATYKPITDSDKFIEVKDLYFKYKQPVLKGISAKIYSGKLYAILGKNGSGKTTLCKIISGLLKGYKGNVFYKGINNVKFCFQNPDLQFVTNSVLEELELSYRLSEKKAIAPEKILEMYGLAGKAELNPHLLSEGQKKLLAIASTLIYEPDALICDEPTFALDRYNARKIMQLLRRLTAENRLVLFTTHDVRFAIEYADSILILDEGRIRFAGSILDFADNFHVFHDFFPTYMQELKEDELKNYILELRRVLGNEI